MPRIYDVIIAAALNHDIPRMLAYRDMLFEPPPPDLQDSWATLHTFFLEVVLGPHPHLHLITRVQMQRPDSEVYPLLAERLSAKLIDMAIRGDARSADLFEDTPLRLSAEEMAGWTEEKKVGVLKWRVLEVLCRML